jgi:CHAT domain-containing protein
MPVIWNGRELALILVVFTPVACSGSSSRLDGYPLTASVLEAMDDTRPYQLRLDDSHRHQPCALTDTSQLIPSASCVTPPAAVLRRLTQLASQVSESSRKAPTTDALWALALLDLSSGTPNGRQLDRAISRLVEVRARDSTPASVLSHLAVAHVARASVRGDARDLYAALDDIERAWERDSVSLAIRFNRALIHTLLKTHRRARVEWRTYDAAETESIWRTEASARDGAITTPSPAGSFGVSAERVRADPQAAREFVLDSLLAAWAAAKRQDDAGSTREALAQIELIAQGLLAARGDSSVWHIVREVGPNANESVSDGVLKLVAGTRFYRATSFVSAGALLAESRDQLKAGGALALADWASLMLGATHMAGRRHDAALRVLDGVRSRAAARGDRSLEARALWAAGIAVGRDGAMDRAEQLFTWSRGIFLAIGEMRNAAFMDAALADVQGQTGRSLEAANSSFSAYAAVARAGGNVRYEDLLFVAQQLTTEGQIYAAAHMLSESLLAASEGKRPKDVPETLGRLALVQVAMAKRERATGTIAEARIAAREIKDPTMRSRLDAELNRAAARVLEASDPRASIALIDSARNYFATIPVEDGGLLLSRARLALQVGDSAGAERDLASATTTIRSLAPTTRGATARQLAATLRDAHRTLIELVLARGDTNLAFSHTVSLPSIGPHVRSGKPPALPQQGAVQLRFVITPNSVLSWANAIDRRSFSQVLISRDALVSKVARFVNVVRSGDDTMQVRLQGSELYRTLFAGHEQLLNDATVIDIYADDVLTTLPVTALSDDRGRFISERYAVRYVAATSSHEAGQGKVAGSGPLLVGNPAWKRSDFPGLEPLRWANDEVQQIAKLYSQHTLLSGTAATKSALLRAMPNHDVIHFAGHSRVAVENPGASHLVLAAGKSFGDGVLHAADIAKLDLRGVKLVVLSSCGTTSHDAGASEAANGLALAFLDAGVDAVVAGLWEVDDEDVVGFTTAFHESLVRGLTPEAALQKARLRERATNKTAMDAIDFATFVVHVRP